MASANGHELIVKRLLDAGAVRFAFLLLRVAAAIICLGWTACDGCLVLRRPQKDSDIKNKEGNTPLHWACLNAHKPVVQLLLERGAVISVLNSAGRTPVDEALSKDDQELIDLINSFNGGAAAAGTDEIEAEEDEELNEGGGDGGEDQKWEEDAMQEDEENQSMSTR